MNFQILSVTYRKGRQISCGYVQGPPPGGPAHISGGAGAFATVGVTLKKEEVADGWTELDGGGPQASGLG